MTEALTIGSDHPCLIGVDDTSRLLREAVEQRAPVCVRLDSRPAELNFSGVIVEGTGSSLSIEIENGGAAASDALTDVSVEVFVAIGGVRYVFETNCMQADSSSTRTVIQVRRPVNISMADRRRSLRRRFRKRTHVTLYTTSGDEPYCDAALLNLSPEGLACRIEAGHMGGLKIGQTLRVAFGLGAPASRFDLNGRIANLTQGGTPNHVVLGIEFIADQRLQANRARLLQETESTHSAEV